MHRYDDPQLGLDWILPEMPGGHLPKLAALPCPRLIELPRLASLGVRLLISLNDRPPSTAAVEAAGMLHLKLPFPDGTAPEAYLIEQFVEAVTASLNRGDPVAVHCDAGLGRTGTMIAAYLVSTGMNPIDAIDLVRSRHPGSIQTEGQEEAVLNWWRKLNGWKTAEWR